MVDRAVRERKNVNLSLVEWDPDSILLDCGCNNGEFTLEIAEKIGTRKVYGIEVQERYVTEAKARGIEVRQHDLNKRFPFADDTFNVVHAAGIIEHLANTDLFIKELYRVLKFDGYAIISTNNLASIHNIFYLISGKQPASVAVSDEVVVGGWGSTSIIAYSGPAHRRLFTFGALIGLCEYHGFRMEKSRGSGFYPFPTPISRILTAILKSYSSFLSIKVRKLPREN
jgi:SAM-dependent methyltransferase